MNIIMNILLLLTTILLKIYAAPLDSCTRIDNCETCINSTDTFGVRCEWCASANSCNSLNTWECPADDKTLNSYNCPFPGIDIRYDETFMRQIAVPLIGSTLSENKNTLTNALNSCFGRYAEVINSYEIFCDDTNLTTCFAYTVYLEQQNALGLVFRGTTNLFQFIDQGISFFLHTRVKFGTTKGMVDGYYLSAFNNIWKTGMQKDFERFRTTNPDSKIWFFGHSLGGGLASIASSYVTKIYNLHPEMVKLVTFGMPRIGDIELAKAHDELVPDSIRVEHAKDPITGLPPRSFPDSINSGSFHHRLEVWYPDGMAEGSKYLIASRPDTTVERSVFPFNIDDHFKYFNILLSSWNGCNNPK